MTVSRLIPLAAPAILGRRLRQGREDAARWREKLGETDAPRPDGRLIWLHAVGLGEVMALRGLIAAMTEAGEASARARSEGVEPDAPPSFLVTSTARSSAEVFARNCPPGTTHQFLPLDAPRYLARFLDHWRPDLSIWAEQDLWPGAIVATARRGIPLALVNARMNAASFEKRRRIRGLYADLYARFAVIEAQDATTARHLAALGAPNVRTGLPLKAAAPAPWADPAEVRRLAEALGARRLWLAASTHPEDETAVLAAQTALFRSDPRWLLLLVPRDPSRGVETGLPTRRRSAGGLPGPDHAIWLGDTFGEMGLWLSLADRIVIGGSFGATGGHNPWEAAALGKGTLHGPNVANFTADYARLEAAGAARPVTAEGLAHAITEPPPDGVAALSLVGEARTRIGPLARDLMALAGG